MPVTFISCWRFQWDKFYGNKNLRIGSCLKRARAFKYGRKTVPSHRPVPWLRPRQPQGIYLSFHNCNLTVSKCTLKGHLSVSDLSCELAVMVKGLCREPPQGANVENYLLTICPVIFSARPPSLVRQLQLPLLSHCCSIGRAASGRIGFPSQ